MASDERAEAPRTERVLPGVWRLRLPLPWPGVPHGNAWAVAADGGIVMFDTGMGGKGRLRQLDLALAQAGFGVEDVRLVVCTHSHTDHYGLAGAIVEGAGCELWMHPRWEHVRLLADDPQAALEQRIEVARAERRPAGVAGALPRGRAATTRPGSTSLKEPDRELVPGVEVETDLGTWQVHETPGHAPSHVVLHQPERKLLISGDHLLGRTVLFFDHGHSPDPVGEFLASLDEVEPLDVDLVLPGHGRTFRDPEAKIAESRRQVDELLGKVRGGARRAARGPPSRSSPRSSARRWSTPRPAPGSCRSSSPASTTWRSPARSSRSRAPTRSAGALDVACPAMASFTIRAPGGRPARDRLRRPHRPPPLHRDHAPAQGRARARGRAGAERPRRDPRAQRAVGPPMREEVIAYERPSRFSYKVLSGLPVRDHVGTVELSPSDGGTEVAYAVQTTPTCRVGGSVVIAVLKQAIKELLGGVAKESERRAADAR